MPNLKSNIFSFILCSGLYFCRWSGGRGEGGVWDPTSFGHAKFEVKNFFLYFGLWTISAGGVGGMEGGVLGGVGTQLFLVMPNLKSKIFPRGGGGGRGSSSFSTHTFHIHTHAIQIRIVALLLTQRATKNKECTEQLVYLIYPFIFHLLIFWDFIDK